MMDSAEPPVVTREIRHLLARDYAALDPELGRAIHLLAGRNAAVSWHKHGVFLDHLIGTYRILRLWGEPRATCLCGLFHSVYANEYVDLALFDARTERGVLAEAVGGEVEELAHTLCLMPRTEFALRVLDDAAALQRGMTLGDPQGGAAWRLSAETVRAFLAVTIADFAEQWFGWQDEVMGGYPHTDERRRAAEHWTKALWPGPLQPSAANMSLQSRLARRLPEFPGPVPPIFERCTRLLSPEDEAAAAALYWRVAGAGPAPDSIGRAADMLAEAIARNPWLGEAHLHLAQLELLEGDFAAAGEHAQRGLRLLLDWGTPRDKRIPWEGWVAWSRVLIKGARERAWPQTLRALNNLGLVE
ncbi:MAG TPA: hypothetical protein VEI03_23090 [Stellaceae bacterium]|nr:hypothetical protein [Stellaceae bacterium]